MNVFVYVYLTRLHSYMFVFLCVLHFYIFIFLNAHNLAYVYLPNLHLYFTFLHFYLPTLLHLYIFAFLHFIFIAFLYFCIFVFTHDLTNLTLQHTRCLFFHFQGSHNVFSLVLTATVFQCLLPTRSRDFQVNIHIS